MLAQNEWRKLSRQIIRRDHATCQAVCGCTLTLTVHHIIPRSEGGSDDPANLITLCAACHNEIEETDIRTSARVRIFVPHWHETVSWWETKPQQKPRAPVVRKLAKPERKMTKPRGIHLRLDTQHVQIAAPEPKTKQDVKPEVKPGRSISEILMSLRKAYAPPTVTDGEFSWVRREIMTRLLDADDGFDPFELNQTAEAWDILLRWWATGAKIPLSQQSVLGIYEESPIYDDFDGLYRPRLALDLATRITQLEALLQAAREQLEESR